MKDTLSLFTTQPLFDACSALLAKLNIQFDRETALPINVTGAVEEFFLDENGEEIFFELEDGSRHYPSQIAYSLGKVIAKEVRMK